MFGEYFEYSVFLAALLWALGTCFHVFGHKSTGISLIVLGSSVVVAYLALLWISLERPPLRTLGETRLWYGVLLPLTGLVVYWRWRLFWLLVYSLCLAGLFLGLNVVHPEMFDKTLMPALQSPWFVPHVVVYMEAYALLSVATGLAVRGLYLEFQSRRDLSVLEASENMVFIGYGFLSLGLIIGAVWAKSAWGHYWTWDPKETWALLTWLCYLMFIHVRRSHLESIKASYWCLVTAFVVLMLCWFGVNYFPSASSSVHTYNNSFQS